MSTLKLITMALQVCLLIGSAFVVAPNPMAACWMMLVVLYMQNESKLVNSMHFYMSEKMLKAATNVVQDHIQPKDKI